MSYRLVPASTACWRWHLFNTDPNDHSACGIPREPDALDEWSPYSEGSWEQRLSICPVCDAVELKANESAEPFYGVWEQMPP